MVGRVLSCVSEDVDLALLFFVEKEGHYNVIIILMVTSGRCVQQSGQEREGAIVQYNIGGSVGRLCFHVGARTSSTVSLFLASDFARRKEGTHTPPVCQCWMGRDREGPWHVTANVAGAQACRTRGIVPTSAEGCRVWCIVYSEEVAFA